MVTAEGDTAPHTREMHFWREYCAGRSNSGITSGFPPDQNRLKKAGFFLPRRTDNSAFVQRMTFPDSNEASSRDWIKGVRTWADRPQGILMIKGIKATLAATMLMANIAAAEGTITKCTDENGKSSYQNWPCGTKPEIEKKRPERPDFKKDVDCGFKRGIEGTAKAVTGQGVNVRSCAPKKMD